MEKQRKILPVRTCMVVSSAGQTALGPLRYNGAQIRRILASLWRFHRLNFAAPWTSPRSSTAASSSASTLSRDSVSSLRLHSIFQKWLFLSLGLVENLFMLFGVQNAAHPPTRGLWTLPLPFIFTYLDNRIITACTLEDHRTPSSPAPLMLRSSTAAPGRLLGHYI
jgi:hypothetical protein